MNDHNLNHRDPETDALIEQLDALGSQNRSTPDANFEQRIMDSISKQIAPSPLPIAKTPLPQSHFLPGWRFNIAAALLIVGSAALLIWSSNNSIPQLTPQSPQQMLVSLENNFDALFDLPDFTDTIDSDMDELHLITDEMHTELSLPSMFMEVSDSSLTEGSL